MYQTPHCYNHAMRILKTIFVVIFITYKRLLKQSFIFFKIIIVLIIFKIQIEIKLIFEIKIEYAYNNQ